MNDSRRILSQITSPFELKQLSDDDLEILCDEIRSEIIAIVSRTGGHLGANLGVVELSVALHRLFNCPYVKIIWDVGHQAYAHKLLTGRQEIMQNLRQRGGASGFTKRSESIFDPFGAAHAATSISAALGFAVARDLKQENNHVIAVIGDGSMSAGMAYEAMNNAGSMKSKLLVILNDNNMSIAPPVGAMSDYLSKILSSDPYHYFRQVAKGVASHLPKALENAAKKAEEFARGMVSGGTLFEELGFYYVGPVDGHNLKHLLPVLENVKNRSEAGPILLHVVTKKGNGYLPAENSADKFHGVNKFDVKTGVQVKSDNPKPTYTQVFSKAIVQLAEQDEKVVAITAAMPSGTGLDAFAKKFPGRFFDVGIAEQHAVTFAAGLACEGFKPFVAIYSTFLQRAYDQVVHDVILQKLPVRFIIDRAGLVGADGATHAGSYDLSYLSCLPNLALMAPSSIQELEGMIFAMGAYNEMASAVRFPRGDAPDDFQENFQFQGWAKGRLLTKGDDVAIIGVGCRLVDCMVAYEKLMDFGIKATVMDVRFIKPMDTDLIDEVVKNHKIILTVEANAAGGFSGQFWHYCLENGLFDGLKKITSLFLPDFLIDHDTPDNQNKIAKINSEAIVEKILILNGQK